PSLYGLWADAEEVGEYGLAGVRAFADAANFRGVEWRDEIAGTRARCGLPAWDAPFEALGKLKATPLQLSRKAFCFLVPSGGVAGEKREWKRQRVNSK